MKKLNNNSQYIQKKIKFYYGGVAFMALMYASSLSHAMEVDNSPKTNPIRSHTRTLWNLGKQVHQVAALENLDKKILKEQYKSDPKLRLHYIKKLSEYLKENPNSPLELKILKSDNESEDSVLSIFYKETLEHIAQSPLTPTEKDFQILKAKTFYHRLPQELTKVNSEELGKDIQGSFLSLSRKYGVSKDKLKYFKTYYMEESPNLEALQDLTVQSSDRILAGKVNFKLGFYTQKNSIDEEKSLSRQSSYYLSAVKEVKDQLPLAKYHLANLYYNDSETNKKLKFYKPEEAYHLYVAAAQEGSPLAGYRLSKLLEIGDKAFGLAADKQEALEWMERAAIGYHPYAQYELGKHLIENQDAKRGLKLLKNSAKAGYSKAQLDLAKMYEEGPGDIVEKNLPLAIFWYHKAADQEERAAYYPLGRIYKAKDQLEKAVHWYSKSPDSPAQVRLGKMTLKGKGQTKNEALAVDYFKAAVSQENPDGNYYLGLMSLQGKGFEQPDPESAFLNFTHSANHGSPKAHLLLGMMQQYGIGTPQDYIKARVSYEEADKQNNAAASYHLGGLYKRGLGVEKNVDMALSLWEKAANLGHKNAAYKVGKSSLKAWLSKNDPDMEKKAQVYLEKAGPEHIDAVYLLGLLEEKRQNPIEALKLYEKAAEGEHPSALFNLGKLHENSLESEGKNKAFEYYKRAVDQHHVDARLSLGNFFQEGIGIPKNLYLAFAYIKAVAKEIDPSVISSMKQLVKKGHQEAILWFEEKAAEGNPHAQQYLGKLLETGILLPQDMPKAIDLYKQASKKGDRAAKLRLADFKQARLLEALGIKDEEIKISDSILGNEYK